MVLVAEREELQRVSPACDEGDRGGFDVRVALGQFPRFSASPERKYLERRNTVLLAEMMSPSKG